MVASSSHGPLPDDAWQIAKARFLADLDAEEQKLFNHATLENLFYATSNANRQDAKSSKVRAASSKLGPLVAAVDNYGKALDIFSSTASLYIAPIWGSMRVVLVLAKTHGKFFDRIVETLERIGDILPRFRDYERIYDRTKHQRLTQALSNAYLEIVVFCTQTRNSLRQQKASSMRRLLKPLSLDREFAEAVNRFRQLKQNVGEEARTCHMIEASEERNTQLVLRAVERKVRLLARLSKIDCMPRHRFLAGQRHEGTGLWLTTREEYRKWGSASTSAVLCCYGIPGSGKSVLASSVIDQLTADQKAIFYYCDYADKRTLEPTNVFGTLARQLLTGIDPVPEALATEIEKVEHDGEKVLDYKRSLSILQDVIRICSSISIHFILDGLDEATERSQELICAGLKEILDKPEFTIKLIITGREELRTSLRVNSKVPFHKVSVSADAIALDIRSYVQVSTRRRVANGSLIIRDPALEAVIVEALVEGAKGMFLWVEFQLQDLSEQETDHGIKAVLHNLPPSLSETYDRLLAKIEGIDRRQYVERMFKWLVAAREPLRVEEILEAIAFTLEDTSWEREKIPTDFKRLVRACGNLVVVDSETRVVQFAHYTVQQYLVQFSDKTFHFSLEDAERSIGDVCVAYLNFTNFDTHIVIFKENAHTDMTTLSKIAGKGHLISSDNPGAELVSAWNKFRSRNGPPIKINMTKFMPSRTSPAVDLKVFTLLDYVRTNWLWHCQAFDEVKESATAGSTLRRDALFSTLIFFRELVFEFRPWTKFEMDGGDNDVALSGLLGWALMSNHSYLIRIASNKMPMLVRQMLRSSIDWFFTTKFAAHDMYIHRDGMAISQGILDYLNKIQETHPTGHGWLYFQMISASRKGHLLALEACDFQSYDLADMNLWFIDHLLFEAATNGHLALVDYMYRVAQPTGHLYVATESRSLNVLDCTVLSGHMPIVRFLLERGCKLGDLYISTKSYLGMIHFAIEENDVNLLEMLLIIEQDPSAFHPSFTIELSTQQHLEILNSSIRLGNVTIFDMLAEYMGSSGLDPSENNGVSPLLYATCVGNVPISNSLLREKSKLDELNRVTYQEATNAGNHVYLVPTPLYVACYNGDLEMARLLVQAGAMLKLASPVKMTAVMVNKDSLIPVEHTLPSELKQIEWPSPGPLALNNPTCLVLSWQYPVMAAIIRGHFDVAHFMIGVGAPPPRLLLRNLEVQSELIAQNYLITSCLQSKIDVRVEVIDMYTSFKEVDAIATFAPRVGSYCPLWLALSSRGAKAELLRSPEMYSLLYAIRTEIYQFFQIVTRPDISTNERLYSALTDKIHFDADCRLLLLGELSWGTWIHDKETCAIVNQIQTAILCRDSQLHESLSENIDPGRFVALTLHARKLSESTYVFFCWLVVQVLSRPTQLKRSIKWCIHLLTSLSADDECYRYILRASLREHPSSTLEQNILLLVITKNDFLHVKYILDNQMYVWETSRENSLVPFGDTPLMFAIRLGASRNMLEILAQASDCYATNEMGETSLDVAIYYHDYRALQIICKTFHNWDKFNLDDPLFFRCASYIAARAMWQSVPETHPAELMIFEGNTFARARAEYLQSRPCSELLGVFELAVYSYETADIRSPEPVAAASRPLESAVLRSQSDFQQIQVSHFFSPGNYRSWDQSRNMTGGMSSVQNMSWGQFLARAKLSGSLAAKSSMSRIPDRSLPYFHRYDENGPPGEIFEMA